MRRRRCCSAFHRSIRQSRRRERERMGWSLSCSDEVGMLGANVGSHPRCGEAAVAARAQAVSGALLGSRGLPLEGRRLPLRLFLAALLALGPFAVGLAALLRVGESALGLFQFRLAVIDVGVLHRAEELRMVLAPVPLELDR